MAGTTTYTWDGLSGEISDGVERKTIPGQAADLKMVRVPAGTRADRHEHPHEQFIQVIEGAGWLECEDGRHKLVPGTVIHLAPNTWHAAVFEKATTLIEVNLRPPQGDA